MRLILILLLLSMSALAEDIEIPLTENSIENIPIELQFTWLSIVRFQMLTDGEQDAIVVSSRDSLVFMMRSTDMPYFENCVKNITNTELTATKNTVLSITPGDERFIYSAVANISNQLFALCAIPKQKQNQNQNQDQDSERA